MKAKKTTEWTPVKTFKTNWTPFKTPPVVKTPDKFPLMKDVMDILTPSPPSSSTLIRTSRPSRPVTGGKAKRKLVMGDDDNDQNEFYGFI